MELDLNHTRTKRAAYSGEIVGRIDAAVPVDARLRMLFAVLEELAANPPEEQDRPGRSVSASNVGDDCARRVQLGIWPTFHPDYRPIKKEPLDWKTRIVFARGHRTEPMMADWLHAARFELLTLNNDGRQFGFVAAGGQIKGFADGVLFGIPEAPPGPSLWETKTISAKNHRAVARHGVVKQYPKYDTQVQLLMAYLQTAATLFTFLNAETAEIYAELVPFDQARAQAASDRAVHILRATRAGELLPRAAASGDVFPCKWCSFKEECWGA